MPTPLVRPQPRSIPGVQFDPFVEMGMAGQPDTINPPTRIVSPTNMNIDPSTLQFDPVGYMEMLGDALTTQQEPDPNKPAPESMPLLTAIDSGYADKRVMGPVDEIRRGVQLNDSTLIDRGQRKLVDSLIGGMTFGERFHDAYTQSGRVTAAHKMAADVAMQEMLRPGSVGGPRAEEAARLGLIQPEELIPGEQTQAMYGHLIPAEPFQMTSTGEPISSVQLRSIPAQPGQESAGLGFIPGARLTPLQEEVVASRQKGLQAAAGRPGRMERAFSPTDMKMQGHQASMAALQLKEGRPPTEEEVADSLARWSDLAAKEDATALKQQVADATEKLNKATIEMREAFAKRAAAEAEQVVPERAKALQAQTELTQARTAYIKQQPRLQRELQGMKSTQHPQHEMYQAIQRVREAIDKGEQPSLVDSALFKSFLMRGGAEYRVNFLGKLYDAYTGEYVDPTLEGASQEGILQQLQKFIGNLFGMTPETPTEPKPQVGSTTGKQESLPTPATPEEAQQLKPGTRYRRPDGKVMVR